MKYPMMFLTMFLVASAQAQTNAPEKTKPSKPVIVTGGSKGLDRDGRERKDRASTYEKIILPLSPIKKDLKAGSITKKQAGERSIVVLEAAMKNKDTPAWAKKEYEIALWQAQMDAGVPPADLDKKIEQRITAAVASGATLAEKTTRAINMKRKLSGLDPRLRPISAQIAEIDATEPDGKQAAKKKMGVLNYAASDKTLSEREVIVLKLRALKWAALAGEGRIEDLMADAERLVDQERQRQGPAVQERGAPRVELGPNNTSIRIASELAAQLDPRWEETMALIRDLPKPPVHSLFAEHLSYIMDYLRARRYDDAVAMAKRYRLDVEAAQSKGRDR